MQAQAKPASVHDLRTLVLSRHPAGTDAHTHPTTDEVVGGVRVLAATR